MITKSSTKQLFKPALENEQLQSLMTELSERQEQAIVGGNLSTQYSLKSYAGLVSTLDSNNLIGIVRPTFTF